MVAVCTGAVRETGISTASGPEAGASGSPRQLPPPSSGAYGGALWSSGTRMPRSPRVAPAPRVLTNVASPRQARMRSYEESPLTSSLPMPMAAPLGRPKLASRPMTARSADRGAAVQAALPRPSSEQSARRRGAQTSRASRRTLASVPMSAPPTAQRAAAVSAAGDGTAGGGDAQRKAFLAHESLCCGMSTLPGRGRVCLTLTPSPSPSNPHSLILTPSPSNPQPLTLTLTLKSARLPGRLADCPQPSLTIQIISRHARPVRTSASSQHNQPPTCPPFIGGLPMMHADGRTYIWPEDLSWLGPLAPPDPAEP